MDVVLVLGAFAGMLLAFYKVLDKILGQSSHDRDSDRKERVELTDAIKLMAKNSGEVAHATTKSAKEAKERNGHLGEQNIRIAQLVTRQNADVAKMKESSEKMQRSNQRIADILSKSALIAAEDRETLLSPEIHLEAHIENQTVDKQTIIKEE